jgi:hypothetical protein
MQLHPDDGRWAMEFASHSIARGFIGLDFDLKEDGNVVGDLLADNNQKISSHQNDYVPFATEMDADDKVLIMVHNRPFAVVTVAGEYNYIRRTEPKLDVWFRHFRSIKDPIYFSDFVVGKGEWLQENFVMPNTIQPLNNPDKISYRLIQEMITWYDKILQQKADT